MLCREKEIVIHSLKDGEGAITIRKIIGSISITGKLEILMREVAHIVDVEAYQNEEAHSLPKQGGVPSR